jgi:Holliday junction DNA helicase RuvA
MIAHLDGVVSAVAPEGAVIDVGGVGLLVQCSPGTLAGLRPGERAKVSTSLVVREDALTLYGFGSDDERNTFELLQTASGIGPGSCSSWLAGSAHRTRALPAPGQAGSAPWPAQMAGP